MPPPTAEARRRAYEAGHGGERLAVLVLRLHGWRILDRRFTVKGGEIDVVARRGDTVAFVEVKRRATLEEAMTSIDAAKRRRIARAARVWIGRHGREPGLTFRADAIFLAPQRWPRHLPVAFELEIG